MRTKDLIPLITVEQIEEDMLFAFGINADTDDKAALLSVYHTYLAALEMTLTNKSFDVTDNTLTNIINSCIKSDAEIEFSKMEELGLSKTVETNGSGLIIATTKGTAYNKAFGTGTTNIPEIGATLVASRIVETDGSAKLITAVKGTAYNKAFGTGTTNIPEIGATLVASRIVETDGSAKLITAVKGSAYNKAFGTGSGEVAQGNDSRINNGQTAYGWGDHASGGYEAAFGKNTAFNLNFGTGITNIPAIGSTLGNSKVVETTAAGKLMTATKNGAYNKSFGITADTAAEGNHTHTEVKVDGYDSGRYELKAANANGSSTDGQPTFNISPSLPGDARIVSCQLRVDTALSDNWDAAYSGGITQAIATNQDKALNTKLNKHFDVNADSGIVPSQTQITITKYPSGNFVGIKQMTAIIYYYTFNAMGDVGAE